LHVDDLSGYLVKRGGVEHVYFPMRYEPTRPKTDEDPGYEACPYDTRTEKGELLVPEIFSEDKVKQLEKDLGAYGTAGQLQQVPVPEGGGMFKRSWFKFLDAKPAQSRIRRSARGWDTAATEQAGDWTVGARIDEFDDGNFLVSYVVRDQLSPAGVDALMLATAQLDGKPVPQREEKEGGASGKTVVDARAKTLVGYDYQGVGVGTSKILRSKPFRAQAEAGNIYLLRASWNEEYIKELCDFPVGKHDDQVDASSCSFNAVLLEPRKRKVSPSW
jgi:predicted phage terminase large subunit-like protein